MSFLTATATVSLEGVDPSDFPAARASKSRSLLFQFSNPEDSAQIFSLGAVLTTSDGEPLSASAKDVPVELLFWQDAAREVVKSGAEFSIWYSRTIGIARIDVVQPVER